MMMRWSLGFVLVGVLATVGGACSPRSTAGTGSNSCGNMECNLPPGASCDGNVAVVYESAGACVEGECLYAELRTECSVGLECTEGACVVYDDPCLGVRCDSPPMSSCNASDVVTYAEEGICEAGECGYPPLYTPCGEWEVCMNAECVDADDPCAMTVCDVPPERRCEGNSVLVFGENGTCAEGACEYPVEELPCGADAACVAGSCDASIDPCEGIVCDSRPDNLCALNTVIIYSEVGQCEAGECRYSATEEVCEQGLVCQQGRCVDPCEGITCEAPPAPSCVAGALVTYAAAGQCMMGECEYEETEAACGNSQLCWDGKCLFFPQPGELVVTEIMYDPVGEDDGYEWFEIHNPSENDLYIGGMVFSDTPTTSGNVNEMMVPEGVFIEAGDYLVFGESEDAVVEGVDHDWSEWGSFTLANNDDELILTWGGGLIERVDYNENQGFPEAKGVSLSLDYGTPATENDGGEKWCFGTAPYFVADTPETPKGKGSPGEANLPCDFLCFDVTCPHLESTCISHTALLEYSGPGVCNSQTGLCSSEPVAEETDCVLVHGGDLNYICREGECVDGCEGISCAEEPASVCENNEVVSFSGSGFCVAGACQFEVREAVACGSDLCVVDDSGASCLPDPCLDQICSVASSICDGDQVVSFTGDGVCEEGVCNYSGVEVRSSCPVGESCFGAECYPQPGPGEIVVTEYLANPAGHDDHHEWFEIYNRTSKRLYLGGLVVKDLGTNEFEVASGLFIEPASYFVFGRSGVAVPGGGPDANWSEMGFFQLANDDDEIILLSDSEVIDALYYDHCLGCFPSANGKSVSLDPTLIGGDNQRGGAWCVGAGLIGEGESYGSPGEENPPCFSCSLPEECLVPESFCADSATLVSHGVGSCSEGYCDYGNSISASDCGAEGCFGGVCGTPPD